MMRINFSSLLKGLDVAGDLGGLEKLREILFPGKKVASDPKEGVDVKGPGLEHIVEGAIIEICAPYILMPANEREGFLAGNAAAHARVAIDFYRRNPALRDTYEKFMTQLPWWALSDGLGARTRQAPQTPAPQPQQQPKQKGGKQQPAAPATVSSSTALDAENVRLLLIFKVCLGMQALDADNEATSRGRKNPKAAGDRVIIEAIERMRSASPFEKGRKALEKGGKSAGDFLSGFIEGI